jgi:hypothetical protein
MLYQTIEPKTERLLSQLPGVKNTGQNKWLALCPAHDDRSPSLSIKQVDDRVLIRCFAGCDYQDVLAAIGLDAGALFPDKITDPYEKPKPAPRFSKSELFNLVVQEAGIVALALNDLLLVRTLSDTDCERAIAAYNAIMRLHCEVYG